MRYSKSPSEAAEPVAGEIVAGVQQLTAMEDIVVREVDLDARHARVTVTNLPDEPGVCARLFASVAEAGVLVDMIVQNLSRAGRADMSFSVPTADLERAMDLTRKAVMGIDPSGPDPDDEDDESQVDDEPVAVAA